MPGGAVILLSKNLNTLPVLCALLEEASVARAARRVGLSQPTVSGILGSLRHQFGDPLLVRSGRGMRLTPRAERLRPLVTAICDELDRLFESETFDPAAIVRTFAIAAPDHLVFLLTPHLLPLLQEEAPNVRIRFVDMPHDLETQLHDGRIDLAVCGHFGLWPSLSFEHLFDERMVAAMWCDHPLAKRQRLRREDLRRYPGLHATSGTPAEPRRELIPTGVAALDAPNDATITLGHFTDGVLLTIGTHLIVSVPEGLVDRLSERLPVTGVPLVESDPFPSGTFWSALHDRDQEHRWMRSVIARAAAHLGP